jgi:formylglycine-generating enzyme required for sulfatase activity
MEPISFVSGHLIEQLIKQLRYIEGDQAQELNLLRDEFIQPNEILKCYVEPDLQDRNPALEKKGGYAPIPRQGAFSLLNHFLGSSSEIKRSKDGSHQLFLLADAGMGKSSLLLILKLLHLMDFWPQCYRCELFRLGQDSMAQIKAVENPGETLLLLDALNEDRLARQRVSERLQDLLYASHNFRRVIITCRTHFFPDTVSSISGQRIIRGLDGYNCPILYVAPFDEGQIEILLRKKFSWKNNNTLDFSSLGLGWKKQRNKAKLILDQVQDLRHWPFLLQHIEILMELKRKGPWNLYILYEVLIQQWLERKLRLLEGQGRLPERNEMFNACVRMARWLEEKDEDEIAAKDLWELFCEDANVCCLERFELDCCSLLHKTANQAFRFRHASFREFLLAYSLMNDQRPLPCAFRATELLVRFLELGQGIHTHLHRLDLSDFNPIRYIESHRKRFVWQDALGRRGKRLLQGGPEMIMLPGGRFWMGDIDGKGSDNARPVHEVELESFALGRYPVTFAEYDTFCLATDRKRPRDASWGRDQQPVINVSWQDAVDYCDWLSFETGRNYRLPSEAEWEYACRAGNETLYCFGDDERQLERYAWYIENSNKQTQTVGLKLANAWGFHDMHGNVWEWCADWYAKDHYSKYPVRNPLGANHGAGRVLRGGSWDSSSRFTCSSFRFCLSPGLRIIRVGFRVALGEND